MKEQRTHDHFYVNEDRYDKPKSSFLQIIELLKRILKTLKYLMDVCVILVVQLENLFICFKRFYQC